MGTTHSPAAAPTPEPAPGPRPSYSLTRSLLIAGGGVIAVLLLVRLADVLLMAFGAILTAVLLHAVAGPLGRVLRVNRPIALTLAVAIIAVALGLIVWSFGREAETQLASLAELVPQAWRGLRERLSGSALGSMVLHDLDSATRAGGLLLGFGPKLAVNAAGATAGTVIVVFAGLYLAYHPQSYLGGVLLLLPRALRPRAIEVLGGCHAALQQWLVGQLFSMLLVGMTTGGGLAIAGVPSPVALGVIAGLGQFVPVVGPMAAAVPGLLAALAAGPATFAWAAAIYLGAAQLEANLFTPLMLRRMAQLPMAITLFAVLAMGVLLGPLGVLFATPLAVVAYVLVKMVYVEGVIGERFPSRGAAPP